MWETQRKQTRKQMEIIKANKNIELIFIYRTINLVIDYRDRPSSSYSEHIEVCCFWSN